MTFARLVICYAEAAANCIGLALQLAATASSVRQYERELSIRSANCVHVSEVFEFSEERSLTSCNHFLNWYPNSLIAWWTKPITVFLLLMVSKLSTRHLKSEYVVRQMLSWSSVNSIGKYWPISSRIFRTNRSANCWAMNGRKWSQWTKSTTTLLHERPTKHIWPNTRVCQQSS